MFIEPAIVEQTYKALQSNDMPTLEALSRDRSSAYIDALLEQEYTPGKTLLSFIKSSPLRDEINQNIRKFNINGAHVDVLEKKIYPLLSNQTLTNLMLTCKTQQKTIEDSATLRSRLEALKSELTYWQDNVSELNLSLDLRKKLLNISIPPNASDMSNFLKAQNILKGIISQVKSEITYLQRNATEMNVPWGLRKRLLNHPILEESTETLNLAHLKATNSLVNEINSTIILSKIDLMSTTLSLNHSYLTRLPLSLLNEPSRQDYWKQLVKLVCYGNQLTNLDVTGLSKLVTLWCFNNHLTNLNITDLNKLERLLCNNNQLINLNFSGLNVLHILDCSNNLFTNLNVTDLSALEDLWCFNNQLTITAELRARFGDAWADRMQATQRAPEPILSAFEAIADPALNVSSVKLIAPKFQSITDAMNNDSDMTVDVSDEDMANFYKKRLYPKRAIT